jgi:hypothetical protein
MLMTCMYGISKFIDRLPIPHVWLYQVCYGSVDVPNIWGPEKGFIPEKEIMTQPSSNEISSV